MKIVICQKNDTTTLWDTKALYVKSKRREVKFLYMTSMTGPHLNLETWPQAGVILHPSSPPGALFYEYLKLFRKARRRKKDLRLCLKESNSKPHVKNVAH